MDGNMASVQELLNYIHEHKLEDCGRFEKTDELCIYVDIDEYKYIAYDFARNNISLFEDDKDCEDNWDSKKITKEEAFRLRGIN